MLCPAIEPMAKRMENQETMGADLSELAAGTRLGVVNHVIETAARPLVGIKVSPDVRKFEEVVEVIEEQNGRNIDRLKLDEEDKELLRPLIAAIVRKSGKAPSPEQQLVAVATVCWLPLSTPF